MSRYRSSRGVVLDLLFTVRRYTVQVQNDEHWFVAHVDAHSGEVVNTIDFVAHASVSLSSPVAFLSAL